MIYQLIWTLIQTFSHKFEDMLSQCDNYLWFALAILGKQRRYSLLHPVYPPCHPYEINFLLLLKAATQVLITFDPKTVDFFTVRCALTSVLEETVEWTVGIILAGEVVAYDLSCPAVDFL